MPRHGKGRVRSDPTTGRNDWQDRWRRVVGRLRRNAGPFFSALVGNKTFIVSLVGLAIVGHQIYRGATVEKLGIPGVFEIELGWGETPGSEGHSATPLPDRLLVADFEDTRRWYLSNADWVKPIYDPDSDDQDGILRFYPPGRDIIVRARRQPMDDLPIHEYCTAQFAVRLRLPEGGLDRTRQSPIAYLVQNGERLASSLLPKLDQGATGWQTVTVPFRDLRSDTGTSWSDGSPMSEFGFEFGLPTKGGTIDVDDVVFLRCSA